ncbi:MAG: nitroreductase family protein [Microscillaceae bacterium]|nr:nitroreductase family protein [Microscillaceae bacterium]
MPISSDFTAYQAAYEMSEEERLQRAETYLAHLQKRRSLREFSDRPVARQLIAHIIKAAGTAPSGAHKQPWTFCAVSNPEIKRQIREAAEAEEYENYHGRMSESWLQDLQAFGTDWQKPFLEIAPWLIVVFRKIYDLDAEGQKHNNYYVSESVGLAAGFLLTAIHEAGLVALTHTPSPMNFLSKVLRRPANEKPFLLIPVGFPAKDAQVPALSRKPLDEICVFFE